MDIFDRAQELEAAERDRLIQQERAATPTGEALDECERCGNEIPDERQAALPGVRTCVECARDIERMRTLFKGR